jgi:hypothetical protein
VNAVLAPEALAEADELREIMEDPLTDTEALTALGYIRWARALQLDTGNDLSDLNAALGHFALLSRQRPDYLPDQVRDHFSSEEKSLYLGRWPRLMERVEKLEAEPGFGTNPGLLTVAKDLLQQAIIAPDIPTPQHEVALIKFSTVLMGRFLALGEQDDLDQSIQIAELALSTIPTTSPNRSEAESILAISQQYRRSTKG